MFLNAQGLATFPAKIGNIVYQKFLNLQIC